MTTNAERDNRQHGARRVPRGGHRRRRSRRSRPVQRPGGALGAGGRSRRRRNPASDRRASLSDRKRDEDLRRGRRPPARRRERSSSTGRRKGSTQPCASCSTTRAGCRTPTAWKSCWGSLPARSDPPSLRDPAGDCGAGAGQAAPVPARRRLVVLREQLPHARPPHRGRDPLDAAPRAAATGLRSTRADGDRSARRTTRGPRTRVSPAGQPAAAGPWPRLGRRH